MIHVIMSIGPEGRGVGHLIATVQGQKKMNQGP